MAKNTTQPRIKPFLKDLSILCQRHGMIIDANGGGKGGSGPNRGESRFLEDAPLVLYTSTSNGDTYRKIGYLWYSFEDDDKHIIYNFEPKSNTPYTKVHL
jgi:hypothetical protein